MGTLLGQLAFSVGGEEYSWQDVTLAGEIWGVWPRIRERLRQGIACLRALENREDVPDDREIQSAANEFRYSRDLVSAQEMEEWLARWSLTADAWMDYVRWTLLRQKWSAEILQILKDFPPDPREVDRFIQAEAVCSGDLQRLAGELAGRAAVHERETNPVDAAAVREIVRRFPGTRMDPGFGKIPEEERQTRLRRLAALELSFRTFRERVVTAERIAAIVRSRRIDWTRLTFDSVSFADEQIAREVSLCVREDGRKLAEVAAAAGGELRHESRFVEEIDPVLRDVLFVARKGDVVGPVEAGSEFALYQIQEKLLPSEADADVLDRAEEVVLKLDLDREITDRVKWAHRL